MSRFFPFFLFLQYFVALDFYSFHYPHFYYVGYFFLWGVVLLAYVTKFFISWKKVFFVFLQFFFLFTLAYSSDGKVDHGLTVYYWISLIAIILSWQKWIEFPFFSFKDSNSLDNKSHGVETEGLKVFLLLSLTSFFALYFCAGVWKMRVLFYNYQLTADWSQSIESLASEIFAYQRFFQSDRREYLFSLEVQSYPVILGLAGTIFLQLISGAYVVLVAGEMKFWRMALKIYLLCVSIFHLSMIYFFDIWFIEQLLLFNLIGISYLILTKNKTLV